MRGHTVEQAIIEELTVAGACQVEDIVERLSGFTWNQVFAAIDRMSRDGTLALQHPARFGYEVSIGSRFQPSLNAAVTR